MINIYSAKKKKSKHKLEERTKIVSKLKNFLKADDIYIELCKEYHQDPEILDGISVVFTKEIDVTAKTINAKIFLNTSLVDEKFEIMARYLLHELVHCFQHMENEGIKQKDKEKEYLDRPEELEAFQYQIKFDAKERSAEKANDYTNDLLSYHKIPKNERKDKKKELFDKLD